MKAVIKKLSKKEKKKKRIASTLFLNTPFRYTYICIYIGNNPTNRIPLPGHRLDPGWIARDAVVMYGSIYIRTLGYGQGSHGFFNNLFKHSVWDSVDQKVIDKY
jgi:hypothetical protein